MRRILIIFLVMSVFTIMTSAKFTLAQQKASYTGQTLRVATWGGKWKDIRYQLIGEQIEKTTGAKVEWILGNPVDHLAKMIAAKGGDVPFDVAELGSVETVQARELGFLEKIDSNLVPNIRKVLPGLFGDDWVAIVAVQYVNAYIPSKFKELGLPPPTHFKDLFHLQLAGKIALPFVGASIVGQRFIVSLAIDEGGSITNIKPALDRLKKAKVSYYYRATSELEMRLAAGEVWAAYASGTRPFLLWAAGKDIDYASVAPAPSGKKASVTISNVVITKGAKNKELAHMYVNYALSPDAQYGMAEWGGVRAVTNDGMEKIQASSKAAIRRIADIPWKDVFTIDLPPDVDIAAKNLNNWVDQFNREVGIK